MLLPSRMSIVSCQSIIIHITRAGIQDQSSLGRNAVDMLGTVTGQEQSLPSCCVAIGDLDDVVLTHSCHSQCVLVAICCLDGFVLQHGDR